MRQREIKLYVFPNEIEQIIKDPTRAAKMYGKAQPMGALRGAVLATVSWCEPEEEPRIGQVWRTPNGGEGTIIGAIDGWVWVDYGDSGPASLRWPREGWELVR